MDHVPDADLIRDHSEKIIASGVLGRSRINLRLFNYLVERSINGSVPKELEIAIDVFDKGAEFDVGHDSLVRVYIHKLRQKINEFYRSHRFSDGNRITIPKGQYRFTVTSIPEPGSPAISGKPENNRNSGKDVPHWLFVVFIFSIILNGYLLLKIYTDNSFSSESLEQVAQHPIWKSLLDDDLPVTVVMGDYYIFAELDEKSNVRRLVRDFSVNSVQDLEKLQVDEPDLSMKYLNVDLNYLPVASASALKNVLPILERAGKTVNVMMMSEFNITHIKNSHLIYIGYISAMDKLTEFVFKSSNLAIAGTYDELTNLKTGETYYSEAGILPFDNTDYRDYGLFSTFPAPDGNQVVIISGTRDEGLMQTAQAVTTPAYLHIIDQALSPPDRDSTITAFEALYEVMGLDRTNLNAMLIFASKLDYQEIWGGDLPVN